MGGPLRMVPLAGTRQFAIARGTGRIGDRQGQGGMRYRQEIDGLRACAVGAVLANHFFEGVFPNGYLGVDIFFVISGYVITGSLAARGAQPLGAFLAGFYARRIKRLVPALALVVLVSSVLICLVDPTPLDYLRTGLLALFGLANIHLHLQATDYFADAAGLNPFTHTWSLGVEEQFYLVFPLLFWLGIRRMGRGPAMAAFVGLVLASAAGWWMVTASDPMLAFYMVFFRFWQIGLGVLAWAAQHRFSPDGGRLGWLKRVALVTTAGVAAGPLALDPRGAAILVTGGTALVLILTGPGRARIALLEAALPTYLGRISYALYLWHWPVAVMLSWTVGLTPVFGGLGIALSLGLADLTWRRIEQPLRRKAWARSPQRELGRGLLAMLGVGAVLFLNGLVLQPHLFRGQRPVLEGVGVGSLTAPYRSQDGTLWVGADCVLSSDGEVGKPIDPAACSIGAPFDSAERRVLVAGNSFSTAFAAAFDGLGATPATAFVLTSSWGASPVPEIGNDTPWQAANAYYWQDVLPRLVDRLRAGDQVLLASDLAGLSPAVAGSRASRDLAALETGLRRLAGELRPRGIGLGVIGPLPFARDANCEPELAMPQWYAPDGGPCRFLGREESLARHRPLTGMLARLEGEGLLRIIAPFDLFCPGPVCGYLNPDGVMMFRDVWSHPSVEAARLMRPLMRGWLDGLARAPEAGTR